MVGAVSDIQLWCLRLPIELGRPLRLCMGHARVAKNFYTKATPKIARDEHFIQDVSFTVKKELHNKK